MAAPQPGQHQKGLRLPRRRLLRAGLAFAVLAAAGSVVALVRTRGYHLSDERAKKLVALSPWQLILVEHVARRIAAPDVQGPAIPSADDTDVAGFVDQYVSHLPARMRHDLTSLFGFVEHVAPLSLRLSARFTRLSPADQDRVLASLESADEGIFRGAFAALKALVFMGYYRDPRTWAIPGYDGPYVGRPEGGWTR